MLAALGERCKLPQLGAGQSPSRKRILEHFSAKKRIWSLVAAILSLNGAKKSQNSYKNHGGPAKRGGELTQGPPLNTPRLSINRLFFLIDYLNNRLR